MTLTFKTHKPLLTRLSATIIFKVTIVFENYTVSLFPIEKPKLQNLTLSQNRPRSSFEYTLMGPSPRCYVPSFVEMGPLVPEKNFAGVLPCMGMAAILVM